MIMMGLLNLQAMIVGLHTLSCSQLAAWDYRLAEQEIALVLQEEAATDRAIRIGYRMALIESREKSAAVETELAHRCLEVTHG